MGAVRCEGVDPGSLICMSKTMPDLGLALWSLLARNVNANARGAGDEGGGCRAENEPPGTQSLYSVPF